MITADKVKSLNKKIEELNARGTREKAKVEVLEGNLGKALEDYQAIYGVSLKGKNMSETAKNIQRELEGVMAETEKEFNLRNLVVDAIERGDIEEANRLLGVEIVEPEEEEVEVGIATDSTDSIEETSVPEVEETVQEESEGAVSFSNLVAGLIGEEDESESPNLEGIELDEEIEPAPSKAGKSSTSGKKPSKGGFSNLGGSVEDTVSELGGDMYSDFGIGEDEFDDFGLGDILSGTKFSID